MAHPRFPALLLAAACVALAASAQTADPAPAAKSAAADNGTDPTKVISSVKVGYEFISLNNGVDSGTLRMDYIQPLGAKNDYSLTYRVPVATISAPGLDESGLGDASLKLGHVFGLNREGGYVAQGEMVFDTASHAALGTGQNVFKGTFIVARFLKNGAIFAPAFVQSASVWGDDRRAKVNATTMDFYYVPKMADPRNLMTYDPSINVDWKSKKEYLNLAITFGRVLGPAFGGKGILLVKPSVFFGGEAPGKWGLEVSYKVIGF